MKSKIIWLGVSSLMMLSLVLASCAPKVTEEEEVVTEKKAVVAEKKEVVAAAEKKEVVTEKGAEMVVDALGRLVPKPQYGGVLNLAETADPTDFSFTALNSKGWAEGHVYPTNEPLVRQDRLKGPAGTSEWTGVPNIHLRVEHLTGWLAERWEIIQPDTIIFHIRKGVHWQDKPPVYGAELTAEDVVYTFLVRWARVGSAVPRNYPYLSSMANPEKSIYIHPDDRWAVVFKTEPGYLAQLWERVANFDYIVPKALGPIEGEGFRDWRGVVGTGPMLLTDYVRGSSLTWQRNPNYWAKDELHPQNQLPYLDGVKVFIIPDLSTQYAALRTGKLDIVSSVLAENAQSLMSTNPELLSVAEWLASALNMRHDTTPFGDVRVRRAMMMAIDHDEIIRDYYGGEGQKFWFPTYPIPEHKEMYVPLEQMPESVQELYTYNPDRAKKLLAEAGYPNGFTTSVTVSAAAEQNIDMASIIAAYWAKVGVTLKIDIKEAVVYTAMTRAFTHPHGTFNAPAANDVIRYPRSRVGSTMNQGQINDPLVEETVKAVSAAYFDWAEVSRITREVTPKLQERALFILLPLAKSYNLWQPWLKGYYGENKPEYAMGYLKPMIGRYVWIDQKLKKAMGR